MTIITVISLVWNMIHPFNHCMNAKVRADSGIIDLTPHQIFLIIRRIEANSSWKQSIPFPGGAGNQKPAKICENVFFLF